MKAYERLNVEVVKFEAQDVITASVAAPVECICGTQDDYYVHSAHPGYVEEYEKEDHTRESLGGINAVKCPASEHPNCVDRGGNIA